MKPLKNRYSITLDEEIADKIKQLAEEDDRSFSQYINMVLRDWLKSTTEDKPSKQYYKLKKSFYTYRYRIPSSPQGGIFLSNVLQIKRSSQTFSFSYFSYNISS